MSWVEQALERSARRAARRISRRSFLARLGTALVGGAALPLLPVSRARADAGRHDREPRLARRPDRDLRHPGVTPPPTPAP